MTVKSVTSRRARAPMPSLAIAGGQRITTTKRELLKRMGLRHDQLSWQGIELLDLYCRTRGQIAACDDYFARMPIVLDGGKVPPVARFYLNAIKTSIAALEALRSHIAEMAREDERADRLDTALAALAAEGQKARAALEQ